MTDYILFLLGGYCIGSIPFGLVLSRLAGYGDIRKIGSGNIGATNVLRTGNKALALATLILDSGKGIAAIALIFAFNEYLCCGTSPEFRASVRLFVGLGAILGHCFPVWLKFKGGKGVATTLGTLLAAVPLVGLIACGTWMLTALISRISSASALMAMAVAPVAAFFLYGLIPAIIAFLIAALVWIRHKDNIKRILNGTEPKIGKKKNNDEKPVSTETE